MQLLESSVELGLVDETEMARRLGITRDMLTVWRKQKVVPWVRGGGRRVFYRPAEVIAVVYRDQPAEVDFSEADLTGWVSKKVPEPAE